MDDIKWEELEKACKKEKDHKVRARPDEMHLLADSGSRISRDPLLGYSASYRRIMETQARLLARHLLGEIPAYKGFRTK